MDADESRGLTEEQDNIFFKTGTATVGSFVMGSILGAVNATWRDIPIVERNNPGPAVARTLGMMGSYGATFAAIGAAFAAAEASSQALRGKKDFWNGVVGGAAAGAVIGIRSHNLAMGVGASAALATVSALVDAGGHQMRLPTGRDFLPVQKGDVAK